MMAKRKWTALLCFHICYLFLGASIFYSIENPLETRKLIELKKQIIDIQRLIYTNYLPSNSVAQIDILTKLSDLCGESMVANLTLDEPVTPIWDFYHAFFFSYTVISTVGYGNLAPTTSMGRIIMIFYALLGVPMNAILFANLGAYFASTFRKLYRKYKEKNPDQNIDYTISRFGLIGQISLYLVPGVIIFIFVPACLFVIFEGWDYVLAVYYAFVTLTTIGFGDYVAAVQDNGFGIYFQFYKAFLIFWITFGLGYIGMCIGFLTQGLRSKKIRELEHKLSKNLKQTHSRIWNEVSRDVGYLRKVLNEITIMRYKPVYRDEIPDPKLHTCSSCPIFITDRQDTPTFRRRAYSEVYPGDRFLDMNRTQSDSDLLAIDRKKTFETVVVPIQPIDLLVKVVDALGSIHSEDQDNYSEKGIHGFSDSQILESERKGSSWSIGGSRIYANNNTPPLSRGRAVSECRVPSSLLNKVRENDDWSWSNDSARSDKYNGISSRRGEKMSMPNVTLSGLDVPNAPSTNILSKLNPFRKKGSVPSDVETDSIMPSSEDFMMPHEYLRKTARGRSSMITPPQPDKYFNSSDRPDEYFNNTARRRFSMIPSPLQSERYLDSSDNEMTPSDYIKRTSKGRLSAVASLLNPQKLFGKSKDEMTPEEYLNKTSKGRYSMNPTPTNFLGSNQNELSPEEYLRKTARGRYSMAQLPSQRYLNNTKSGRGSKISTSSEHADILEQTTLADLIRAIEALHSGEQPELPRRKVGTATPPASNNPLITLTNESEATRRLSIHSIKGPATPDISRRRQSINSSVLPPAVARRRLQSNPTISAFNPSVRALIQDQKRERRFSTTVSPPCPPSDIMRRRALGGVGRRLSMFTTAPSPRLLRHPFAPTITENIAHRGRTRDNSLPEIKIDKPDD